MFESQKLVSKKIDDRNIGLFTKSEFKTWQAVLECKPLAAAVISSLRQTVCYNCMLQKQVSRCSQCKIMHYCSKQCQREDWNFHKSECGILKKMTVPPSKITAQFALNLRIWMNRGKSAEVNEHFENMRSLLEYETQQRIQQFQELSVVLLQNLGVEKDSENMAKMMKQVSAVSINAFTIQDYLCNVDAIGIGIYWPANFINHDCHPNCTQIYDGNRLKIIARRPIQSGEQITICYMPETDDYKSRQNFCRTNYLFKCFCDTCQIDKMFDWSIFFLMCSRCNKKSITKTKKKEVQDEQWSYHCSLCELQISLQERTEMIDQLMHKFESEQDFEKMKKIFFEMKKIESLENPKFEKIINKMYLTCLERGAESPKYYQEAYILIKQILEMKEKWYRLNEEEDIPYTYSWKYAQAGKLAYNLNKMKKAWAYTEKAYEIIVEKVKFKNQFIEVKQLSERYSQLKIALSFNKAEIFKQ